MDSLQENTLTKNTLTKNQIRNRKRRERAKRARQKKKNVIKSISENIPENQMPELPKPLNNELSREEQQRKELKQKVRDKLNMRKAMRGAGGAMNLVNQYPDLMNSMPNGREKAKLQKMMQKNGLDNMLNQFGIQDTSLRNRIKAAAKNKDFGEINQLINEAMEKENPGIFENVEKNIEEDVDDAVRLFSELKNETPELKEEVNSLDLKTQFPRKK